MFCPKLHSHGILLLLLSHVSRLHGGGGKFLCLALLTLRLSTHLVGYLHLIEGFLTPLVGDVHLLVGNILHLLAYSLHDIRVAVALLIESYSGTQFSKLRFQLLVVLMLFIGDYGKCDSAYSKQVCYGTVFHVR